MRTNVLYYGDNLDILERYIERDSIDLVYLDPPFNSNRDYNVIFKDESGRQSDAQLVAFEDTWHRHVTREFGGVLHHVRRVGNLGAHAGDEIVEAEEAERALGFTTAILRNLFEIPADLAAIGGEAGGQPEKAARQPETTSA